MPTVRLASPDLELVGLIDALSGVSAESTRPNVCTAGTLAAPQVRRAKLRRSLPSMVRQNGVRTLFGDDLYSTVCRAWAPESWGNRGRLAGSGSLIKCHRSCC